QNGSDRADDAFGDPVLQIKRVFEGAVEAIGPEVLSARRLDELTGDADAVARLAETALNDVPHAEVARDLLRVGGLALVAEAGVAGHNREPTRSRQLGDQILGHAVQKELGFGIATEILERQYRKRRPVERRGSSSASGARLRAWPIIEHDPEHAHRARYV